MREGESVPPFTRIVDLVLRRAEDLRRPHLRPVINATGVVIHTNLGRSPLSTDVMEYVTSVATQYSTLEYDLDRGARGSRHDHVSRLVEAVTGAEAAMVVNNNAAAVLLALSAMAQGREVVVSRGELVEIGGAFRIPEVMALSGAHLREVGSTNKTHLRDYEAAITGQTGLLLKVHQSNFRMIGFTESVSTEELVRLGRAKDVPVLEDLGSGVLFPFQLDGVDEPSVAMVVAAGIDVATFSGDKLLGGPQAGIIAGRRDWITAMKKHPLARAVRVDKMTLAALEVVIRAYLEGNQGALPLWQMIEQSQAVLEQRANDVMGALRRSLPASVTVSVHHDVSEVGGGSLPGSRLPTVTLHVKTQEGSQAAWERALRRATIPVVCRLHQDQLIFDLRTIFPSQEPRLVDTILEGYRLMIASDDWSV